MNVKRVLVVVGLAGVALVVLLGGVGWYALSRSNLLETHSERRALLERALVEVRPPEFHELSHHNTDCAGDFLTGSPNCIVVTFLEPSISQEERINLLRARATAAGWTVDIGPNTLAHTQVGFNRGRFRGRAAIASDVLTQDCVAGREQRETCVDRIEIDLK